jgi:NADPH-dependent F420 reductase
VIAILGGTGAEGSGLAFRWAHAGHRVIVASRSPERAVQCAQELNALLGSALVRGLSNEEAVGAAEIVLLAVPFAAQRETAVAVARQLVGKILIDVTVPLKPPKVDRVALPEGRSAVGALQDVLGPEVRVVAAFQNVSAHHLKDLAHAVDCDVLVCGNDPEARETVVALAADAGMRGLHAGAIDNAAAVEALTSVLIFLNKRYKVPGTGIRITGI